MAAIDRSSKESYQLVSFVHAGGAAYYTDWTSDVDFGGNTYISTPDMEVKWPKNDGVFSTEAAKIALPLNSVDATNNTFAERISNGAPHAEVTCTINEVVKATVPGPAQALNKPVSGTVGRVRRNYLRKRNKIQIQVVPIKAQIADINMGVPCFHLCGNNVGDAACKVDMTADTRTVTVAISVIDGREITILTNATVEGKADFYYHRGYMQFEGLNVGIQEWRDTAPLTFFLTEQPPAHWAGENVTLLAGCDQSIDTCRTRFEAPGGAPAGTLGNEVNFNGKGIGMPAYHPNFEDAPDCG